MSWFTPFIGLKKRICRYLLQRYLGQFIEEKIDLEQLKIDLYNGTGSIANVTLKCETLNELFDIQGWSIEVLNGHVGEISLTIPWNALMTDDSSIEVNNLFITLKPLPRQTENVSMFESMWSSISSSMQLAKECLENEANHEDMQMDVQHPTVEGLEKFAQIIDNVLNKIKAKFDNAEIRIEYVFPNSNYGIAIIVKINKFYYQNEVGSDSEENILLNDDIIKKQLRPTYASHHISLQGLTFYTEEFMLLDTVQQMNQTRVTNLLSKEKLCIGDFPFLETEEHLTENLKIKFENDIISEDNVLTSGKRKSCPKNILMAKWDGNQEIIVKVKQSENINGPKVNLDMHFGCLRIFLSPRQFHLLGIFSNEFNQQNLQSRCKEFGETTTKDFSKNIQCEKLYHKPQKNFSSMSGGIGNEIYWCDTNEDATNLNTKTNINEKNSKYFSNNDESLKTNYCKSMDNSMTSNLSGSSVNFYTKSKNVEIIDISHFNIEVANIVCVLLHEDILLESLTPADNPLSKDSVFELISLSNQFFGVENSFSSCKCLKNHLRFECSPIIFEGKQQRKNNIIILNLTTSLVKVDFEEVLDNIVTPILKFNREKLNKAILQMCPEIKINLKTINYTEEEDSINKSCNSKMNFNFTLEPNTIELDVTLYDRLNCLLGSSPFKKQLAPDCNDSNTKKKNSEIELKVGTSCLTIYLRFPIIDLRPLSDPNRLPWWKKNIRPDSLLINIIQFRLNYMRFCFEIIANEVDFFYCADQNSPKVHVAKTSVKRKNNEEFQDAVVEYPKIIISLFSEKCVKMLNINDSDSGDTSAESFSLFSNYGNEYLPFSSKRVCIQSDTPHSKTDSETIFLPGESFEMKKFYGRAMKASKLQLKVLLPIVSFQINSKNLYEALYNRLNSDLLMWEPISPNLTKSFTSNTQNSPSILKQSLSNTGLMESIYIPSSSSTTKKDSISSSLDSTDNEDDDSDDHSLYYSAYNKKRNAKPENEENFNEKNPNNFPLNSCSFDLKINQGIGTLFLPVRDSENQIIPGQFGEFILKGNDINIFSVNGYTGNQNLGYFCTQIKYVEAYHCGLISDLNINSTLRLLDTDIPSYIQPILYKTLENSTLSNLNSSQDKRKEMISVAIEMKKIPEQRIKRLRITIGVEDLTLKYNYATSQEIWLNQIIDMFDVLDDPIEGYNPYTILSEMQLHLWDFVIDYRPLNLKYRSLAEFNSLMIFSNLASSNTGCTLRFIAEECALSLAPYDNKSEENRSINKIKFLSAKGLVPILDLGLLDISLRLNRNSTEFFPKLDLRASIQDMHLRTCSDSGQALSSLVAYLADNGDLSDLQGVKIDYCNENEGNLISVNENNQEVFEINSDEQKHVTALMAEAVKEISIDTELGFDHIESDKEVEVYFFPDETHSFKNIEQKSYDQNNDTVDKNKVNEKIVFYDGVKTTIKTKEISKHDAFQTNYCDSTLNSNVDDWNFDFYRENTNEFQDLLNFETSVTYNSFSTTANNAISTDEQDVEALPQIRKELGDVQMPFEVSNIKIDKKQSFKKSSVDGEDFYFIPYKNDAYMRKCGKEEEVLNDPLRIVDNHFSLPLGKADLLKAPENFPMAVARYTLCEMTLTWHLYGGNDFDLENVKTNRLDNEEVRTFFQALSDTYKTGVSYSKSQQSVQFDNSTNIKASWKTKGGCNRNYDVLVEIQFVKVRLSHEIYPTHTFQASRQIIIINELEIRDRLRVSEINKFLYHPSPRHLSKKSSQHMIVIKALHMRPNISLSTQECSLRISLLPLRLNIDQNTLLFLLQFFNNLSNESIYQNSVLSNKQNSSKNQQMPIMTIENNEITQNLLEEIRLVDFDLSNESDKSSNVIKESVLLKNDNINGPIYFSLQAINLIIISFMVYMESLVPHFSELNLIKHQPTIKMFKKA